MRILFLFFLSFLSFYYPVFSKYLVLKNAQLIISENFGKRCRFYPNSTIIIKGKLIYRVGRSKSLPVPYNARVYNLKNRFVIPGLIDGFAAINNQQYANAYLYCGVTSIIAVGGGRRGIIFEEASPSPNLFKLEGVGENKTSKREIVKELNKLKKEGFKVILLMYKLDNSLLRFSIHRAKERGFGTIGELGFANYLKAIDLGINAFVHTTRYSLFLADSKMARAVARKPFSDNLNSPKWKYYKWLSELNLNNRIIREKIKKFASKKPVLIPTFGLLYLDLPVHKNPWKERVSILINPEDLNNPSNKASGRHDYDVIRQKAYTKIALKQYELEKMYYKNGALYLTGSGTDVWGSMPGIFLHYEIKALRKIGLSPCEALSAATSNFSDVFGWKIGKIKKNFTADILVLSKNTLEKTDNLRSIHMIFHNERQLKREFLLGKKKEKRLCQNRNI